MGFEHNVSKIGGHVQNSGADGPVRRPWVRCHVASSPVGKIDLMHNPCAVLVECSCLWYQREDDLEW